MSIATTTSYTSRKPIWMEYQKDVEDFTVSVDHVSLTTIFRTKQIFIQREEEARTSSSIEHNNYYSVPLSRCGAVKGVEIE